MSGGPIPARSPRSATPTARPPRSHAARGARGRARRPAPLGRARPGRGVVRVVGARDRRLRTARRLERGAEVAVAAGIVPPAPDAVTAAYLDPADPSLRDEHRALVERDGPGLLVEWTWPADHRIAAPDVEPRGEFRVYARRGDPNVLNGTVLGVTDRGDRSRLAPIGPCPAIATTSPASACASAAQASRSSATAAPRSRSPTSPPPPSARRPGRSRSTSRPRARCPPTSRCRAASARRSTSRWSGRCRASPADRCGVLGRAHAR